MANEEQMSLNEYLGVSAYPIDSPIIQAIEKLAATTNDEARGAIYTRIEVVEFILDLVGYKPDFKTRRR